MATSAQQRNALTLTVGLVLATAWAWWPHISTFARVWSSDPQYSHGYIVPLISAGLLWCRRDQLENATLRVSWSGLILIFSGLALRFVATFLYLEWVDQISLLPVLSGSFLLVGGRPSFFWSMPAVGFLFFMIPLPHSLQSLMQLPLRKIGTVASVYVMQTLGLPALAEGRVIILGDHHIGVAEACSGLRMLMVFGAMSTAIAILSTRPVWERMFVVVSALPIALIVNVGRISVTGLLHATSRSETARLVFHDLAGWIMMPAALLLLAFECWILRKLFVMEDRRSFIVDLPSGSNEAFL